MKHGWTFDSASGSRNDDAFREFTAGRDTYRKYPEQAWPGLSEMLTNVAEACLSKNDPDPTRTEVSLAEALLLDGSGRLLPEDVAGRAQQAERLKEFRCCECGSGEVVGEVVDLETSDVDPRNRKRLLVLVSWMCVLIWGF